MTQGRVHIRKGTSEYALCGHDARRVKMGPESRCTCPVCYEINLKNFLDQEEEANRVKEKKA
jgi:hypothetical protein